jgi:hypothetical protein
VKIRRLGALVGALALALSVAGVAAADSPSVASVVVDSSVGLDVQITFQAAWDKCPDDGKYIGAAISWGDGNSGNTITGATATYDFGAANHVSSPLDTAAATNCVDPIAPWTATHTYAGAGTFDICPVVYDLRDADVPGTGNHSDTAGGADRNQDNSVEDNDPVVDAQCVSVEVAPATSTEAPASDDNGTLPLILLIVGAVAAVAVVRPISRRSR